MSNQNCSFGNFHVKPSVSRCSRDFRQGNVIAPGAQHGPFLMYLPGQMWDSHPKICGISL